MRSEAAHLRLLRSTFRRLRACRVRTRIRIERGYTSAYTSGAFWRLAMNVVSVSGVHDICHLVPVPVTGKC